VTVIMLIVVLGIIMPTAEYSMLSFNMPSVVMLGIIIPSALC